MTDDPRGAVPTPRIAIVGSRDFSSRADVLSAVASLPSDAVVVSGGARGVDTWAIDAAKARGLQTIVLPADWKRYGRSAGYRRNGDIVAAADRVIAFWDGKSKGTMHTVSLARQAGKPVDLRTVVDD